MIVTGYLIDREELKSLKVSTKWRLTKHLRLIKIFYASLRSGRAFKTKPIAVSAQKYLSEFTDYIKRK